jgi:hypothetical protein
MRSGLLRAICAAALLAALVPAAAAASRGDRPPRADFQALYDEYRSLGVILGCSHREADLRDALSAVPADIKAYDPGFVDALDSALEGRVAGCSSTLAAPLGQPTASAGTVVASDGSPGPARPPVAGPFPASATAGVTMPAALLALSIVVGAALLAATAIAVGRHRGWHPGRHH